MTTLAHKTTNESEFIKIVELYFQNSALLTDTSMVSVKKEGFRTFLVFHDLLSKLGHKYLKEKGYYISNTYLGTTEVTLL